MENDNTDLTFYDLKMYISRMEELYQALITVKRFKTSEASVKNILEILLELNVGLNKRLESSIKSKKILLDVDLKFSAQKLILAVSDFKVLRFMYNVNENTSIKSISTSISLPKATINDSLNRLSEGGFVKVVGSNKYCITKYGIEFVNGNKEDFNVDGYLDKK